MASPLRTCVGCRTRAEKRELLRIVWNSDLPKPGPQTDRRQIAPGRGAYLHPDADCLAAAVKRRAVGRALRVSAVDPAVLTEVVTPYLAGRH